MCAVERSFPRRYVLPNVLHNGGSFESAPKRCAHILLQRRVGQLHAQIFASIHELLTRWGSKEDTSIPRAKGIGEGTLPGVDMLALGSGEPSGHNSKARGMDTCDGDAGAVADPSMNTLNTPSTRVSSASIPRQLVIVVIFT